MIKDNRGFSMIGVILIVMFVSVLVGGGLKLASANYKMKHSAGNSSLTFYTNEEALNLIRQHIEDDCAQMLTEAYTEVESAFSSIPNSEDDEIFASLYSSKLSQFYNNTEIKNILYNYLSSCVMYNDVTGHNVNRYGVFFDSEPFVTASDESVVIHNIGVGYVSETGVYSSTIYTDVVINIPEVFGNLGTEKNLTNLYSNYVIVADNAIVNEASESIHGNVYAGEGGVQVGFNSVSAVDYNSDVFLTRGDIAVYGSSTLDVAGYNTGRAGSVYANNIMTKRGGSVGEPLSSMVSLNAVGDFYVKGDLILNVRNAGVNLSGTYYGYTKGSSAMSINASGVDVNLTGLRTLWLSGTSYVTAPVAGGVSEYVLMGESLTGKFSQSAYLVPSCCISGEYQNPVTESEFSTLTVDISKNALNGGIDLSNYVDPADSFYPVHVRYVGGSSLDNNDRVYLYLKFKSEQDAANYFKDFSDMNDGYMLNRANSFKLGKITLGSSSTVRTLGNVITFDGVNIDILNNSFTSSEDFVAYKESYYSSKYTNLVSSLSESGTDLLTDSLFNTIINRSEIERGSVHSVNSDLLKSDGVVEYLETMSDGVTYKFLVVKGDVDIKDDYTGIVIATGDINIVGSPVISGLLISGNNVSFALSNGAVLDKSDADSSPTLYLLKRYSNSDRVVKYFKQINDLDGTSSVISILDMPSTVTFKNWMVN